MNIEEFEGEMAKIKLQHGEALLGDWNLHWDDKIADLRKTGQVYITSRRLILTYEDVKIFRASETFEHSYPLTTVKSIELTRMPKNSFDDDGYRCKVYLQSGYIEFFDHEYEDFAPFVNTLNSEITGSKTPLVGGKQTLLSDVSNVIGSVTGLFGKKQGKAATEPKKISKPCPGCGATLTGWEGKTVVCDYCGATRQL